MLILLQIFAACLFFLYSLSFLIYHRINFLVKQGYWFFLILFTLVNLSFGSLWGLKLSSHYGALILLAIIIVELKTMYKMNFMQILFESAYFVASIYWSRGIVLPILALCLNQSVQWVRYNDFYQLIGWIISMAIMFLYNGFFRNIIAPSEKMEKLYHSKDQLQFVALFQTTLLAYLLSINLGSYYGVNLPWYKVTYVVSCIICFFAQDVLVNHGIKISTLLKSEMHNKLLQKQLAKQLQHYNAYQKYTQSFRAFKHDYKNMMASVKSLLSSGKYDKAEKMLDTIHDTMQKQVLVHKTYSNHIILDAVLQDAANTCLEQNIQFSAVIYIPPSLKLSDINIVRIFSNLTDNAIEACIKIPQTTKRFLNIKSSLNKDNSWLTVEISNSFIGKKNISNEIPKSTKKNSEIHGIGLSVVSETIKKLNGIITINADVQEQIFAIKILLPIHIKKSAE